MKISYIITPSVSTEYLIRCFNSLYRQTNSNFEIILAENRFNEKKETEIKTYLSKHEDIKRISCELDSNIDKIKEALTLIADDIVYITFLSADTVVAPITTELVLREVENAELVITSVVLKEEKTTFNRKIENSLFDTIKLVGVQRVFYGKTAISKFKVEFFENETEFELYKFNFFKNEQIACIEDVCFYIDTKEVIIQNNIIKNYAKEIVELAMRNNRKETTIKILDYYLRKYTSILECVEEDVEIQEIAYETVRDIGSTIREDVTLSRLFQLYTGCTVTEVQDLDFLSYQVFKDKIVELSYTSNSLETLPMIKGTRELQEKQVSKMDILMSNQEQLTSNIAEVKANMHCLMKEVSKNGNQSSLNFIDPIEEIPALFSQGKLGFTIIIKSIKAWIRYKIKGRR